MTAVSVTVTTTVEVPISIISNAIVGAFEGGSTEWVQSADLISGWRTDQPPGVRMVWWGYEEVFANPFEISVEFDDPNSATDTTAKRTVKNEDIGRALALMANKSASHFADLIAENDDADTHDVFMQYLILDDIVYG